MAQVAGSSTSSPYRCSCWPSSNCPTGKQMTTTQIFKDGITKWTDRFIITDVKASFGDYILKQTWGEMVIWRSSEASCSLDKDSLHDIMHWMHSISVSLNCGLTKTRELTFWVAFWFASTACVIQFQAASFLLKQFMAHPGQRNLNRKLQWFRQS